MNAKFMNTKESYVLASLTEFVKLLGSGSQATFHLECKDRQALVQFSSFLGPPAAWICPMAMAAMCLQLFQDLK